MSFDAMKGWFVEVNNQWRGTALAIEVEEILHDAKSDYQVRLFLRMLH
jgi:spermidine synthase